MSSGLTCLNSFVRCQLQQSKCDGVRSGLIVSNEEEPGVHGQAIMVSRLAIFVVNQPPQAGPQRGVVQGLHPSLFELMCQIVLILHAEKCIVSPGGAHL